MIANEQLQPMAKAVQQATGVRPHLSTILRWATHGCHGIRLETVLVGGRRYTSTEAVRRFTNACTEARGGIVAPITTPAEREREADASAERLRKLIDAPKRGKKPICNS